MNLYSVDFWASLILALFILIFPNFLINQPQELEANYPNGPLINIKRSLESESPCESFFKDLKLILCTEGRLYHLKIIKEAKCFENENFFNDSVDLALQSNAEISLIDFFIPLAVEKGKRTILERIFGLCALNSKYFCVKTILKIDPLITFEGNTILHLAAKIDDVKLASLTPPTVSFLHLRNLEDGVKVPSKYVISLNMIIAFRLILKTELEISPFPKEITAHIGHFKIFKNCGLLFKCSQKITKNLFERAGLLEFSELKFKVNRNSVLKGSFEHIQNIGEKWYSVDYYYKYFIGFIDEQAIDMGGVTNEWFSLLLDSFFIKNSDESVVDFILPLFQPISEDSNLYAPTNFYSPEVYKFAGSIMAAALEKQIPTGVKFIPSFYRVLLGIEPFRSDDLQIQDPNIYKNMQILLKDTGEAEKARGYLDLTLEEVPEYIEIRSKEILYERYKESIEAFAVGFRSKLSKIVKLSEYYDLYDLPKILRGKQNYNQLDFKNSFKFVNTISSRHIFEFMAVLSTFTPAQCLKLVKFINGRSHLPYGGISALKTKMNVYFRAFEEGNLPCASTCTSTLYLPQFDLAEQIRDPLIFAIENCDTLDRE